MSKSILIVDDSASIREILRYSLEFKGYAIQEAQDGKEGWEMLQQQPFDLVISDLAMPNMNGVELLQKIRSEHNNPDLPLILCTAEDVGGGEEYIKKGANRLIKKPLSPKELLEFVTELLE